MIKLYIGIFLFELKGLMSLPSNSGLYSAKEVESSLKKINMTYENITFLEIYSDDTCNCSSNLFSFKYKKENEYLITFTQEGFQFWDQIVKIECLSNKTGEKVELYHRYATEEGIIIFIVHPLIENDIYTLFLTYGFYKNCSNCTATLEFKAPEKLKRNIPLFVGIVAAVTLMIIAMCFYNIRSKCIYRYIQEIKRLPTILYSHSKRSTELEINPINRICS